MARADDAKVKANATATNLVIASLPLLLPNERATFVDATNFERISSQAAIDLHQSPARMDDRRVCRAANGARGGRKEANHTSNLGIGSKS
jgi:hypothetical protein